MALPFRREAMELEEKNSEKEKNVAFYKKKHNRLIIYPPLADWFSLVLCAKLIYVNGVFTFGTDCKTWRRLYT